MLGVCAKQTKDRKAYYNGLLSLSLYLYDGKIYNEAKVDCTIELVENHSMFEVWIDMNKGTLEWLGDGNTLFKADMSNKMRESELHPIVSLWDKDDEI